MPVLPFAFSPWMIAAFIVWTVGGALILIDFYRLRQKRQRGEPSSWYASPLLWFSACAFPIGLMVAMISASSFFYGFSGYWLIAAFILMLLFLAGGLIAVVRWDVQQVALQQEERLRQLAASNPWTIAASRPIANLAMTGMVIIGFFVAFFASMSILSFYTLLFPNSMWWMILSTVLLIALLILLAGSIALSSVQKRFYKRLNVRKSLLAAENSYLTPLKLAVQEPLQTLMPPLALYLKRIIIACYLVLVAAYVLLLLHFTDALTITSTIFQLLIYLPFWLFYLLRGWREQVEATTQTLTVTRGIWFARQKQHIPWQEARLFIC